MLTRFLAGILLILIGGCGFHLRGTIPLNRPLPPIYLQTKDPYGQLAKNLQQVSSIEFTRSPSEAAIILVILDEQEIQQLLSVSGTQQTRQYNLILKVSFQVTDNQGNLLVPPQTVTESRALTVQSNQILAGSNEAENLYYQIRQAIVFDIMNRLTSDDIAKQLAARHL